MFKSYSPKRRIFLILTFMAYVCCMLFVTVEACLPGTISGNHSDTVGGGIADIINGNATDQTVIIEPTGVAISNKEKTDLYVGDTLQLSAKILPENSSFESLTYESSQPDILSVDPKGLVTAKKEGTGIITCYSTSFPSVKDTLSLTVHNIDETKIESVINKAKEGSDGVYDLECNKTYTIKTTFTPSNTTIKTLSYESDCLDGSITLNNGTIRTNSVVIDPITITIKSKQGFENKLKIKVHESKINIIPLTKIVISKTEYVQSVGESINVSSSGPYQISFEPSNATYKTYKLEISDSTIASVSSSAVRGLKNGTATLKVTSLKYPELSDSRTITIDTVHLNSIGNIYLGHSSSPTRNVGESRNLTYQNPSPRNASAARGNKNDHILYESSVPEVAKVDSNGKVTARKEGTSTLTRKFYDTKEEKENHASPAVTKSISVKVVVPPEPEGVYRFTLKNTLSEANNEELVLYNSKSYPLSSKITVDKLYNKDGKEITSGVSKTLNYAIDSVYPEEQKENLSLSNGTFVSNAKVPLQVTFKITHKDSSLSKYVTYYLINKRNRKASISNPVAYRARDNTFNGISYPSFDETAEVSVSDTLDIKINPDIDSLETYRFTFETDKNKLYSLTNRTSKGFSIHGRDEGDRKVLVTPLYQDHVFTGNSRILHLSIYHRYIEKRSIKRFKGTSTEEISLDKHTDEKGTISLEFTKGEKITYQLIKSPENYTKENIRIQNSNSEAVTVKDGVITRKNIGTSTIVFEDRCSENKITLNLYVVNKSAFASKPFTLKQTYLSYDKEKNVYHIQNGTSAKITTNFSKDSTYKTVTYQSSNREILQIGNDGNITPLKVGECKITATVDDGNTIHRSYSVNIVVDKKGIINNRKSFLAKLRKGLGHFGAFLITGICSTLFYLFLAKRRKQHLYLVPINFVQGFALAGLTELIQLFVPGRCGAFSDVRIDYIGFLFSSVSITLLFFLIPFIIKLVKYLIEKQKSKKANP